MAQFHFIEDYRNHVARLVESYPLDEAMSLAVGGNYDEIGAIAADVLRHAGVREAASVLDFGCGSGRVASKLDAPKVEDFVGIDVVQELLDYAATKCPDHYRFMVNEGLDLPVEAGRFEFVYAFSVFTHLLQTEIFAYLKEFSRVMRPNGKLVFSFLEFRATNHWAVFEDSVATTKANTLPHLNTFTDRVQLDVMAKHAGFDVLEYIDGNKHIWLEGKELGQSIAIWRKHAC